MWLFPTLTESFFDADAAASAHIGTVNQERWRRCEQTGEEFVPLMPPVVSAPFLFGLSRGSSLPQAGNTGELALWYNSMIERFGADALPNVYQVW